MTESRFVLMIGFHYPPAQGSSGPLRTVKFAKYLPARGWNPIVLTVTPEIHAATHAGFTEAPPPQVIIRRAPCLDAARHLALRGRYTSWMALPDRWGTWIASGVVAGLAAVRRHRPHAIWSTFPIASAHVIGLALSRMTGLPWVADFRDPMVQVDYPNNSPQRRVWSWIERNTIRRCRAATFTAPTAVRLYAERYPDIPADRLRLILNGFDEADFGSVVERRMDGLQRPVTLLHSGTLYPLERNPFPLFAAIAQLKSEGRISNTNLRVLLRATGHDTHYRTALRTLGIDDIVIVEPCVDHRSAVSEMEDADGLLLLQGDGCNYQIPAKVYEYLRIGRPIVALTHPEGDTAATLAEHGITPLARLTDTERIKRDLPAMVELIRTGAVVTGDPRRLDSYTRESQAGQLAELLDEVTRA